MQKASCVLGVLAASSVVALWALATDFLFFPQDAQEFKKNECALHVAVRAREHAPCITLLQRIQFS